MKLLIGSTNPGKAKELERFARELGFETVMPADVGLGSVEETGVTFEENALLKATTYAKESGLLTLADDSGLEIDALNGAPGVYSRRWAGEDATDLQLAETVIERLRDVPTEKRTARLKCVVAAATPEGETATAWGAIEGHIAEEFDVSKIPPGMPYRSLLIVDRYGKLYADLTDEEHDEANHRKEACTKLTERLLKLAKLP